MYTIILLLSLVPADEPSYVQGKTLESISVGDMKVLSLGESQVISAVSSSPACCRVEILGEGPTQHALIIWGQGASKKPVTLAVATSRGVHVFYVEVKPGPAPPTPTYKKHGPILRRIFRRR